MISNCGRDERSKYSGGSAGDQSGTEYQVRSWYNRPWNHVLRPPTTQIGSELAVIATAAAENNNIGYDQSQRLTYYNALRNADWNPENITTKCETDCSASTAANVIAVGHILGISALANLSPSLYSGNIRSALVGAGFEDLTSSTYTDSASYLLPGDILLYEGHHVAINLTAGKNAKQEEYPDGEGAEVSLDVSVDHSAVQAQAGTYDVTFTAGGSSVTVKCTVLPEGETPESKWQTYYENGDASVIDQIEDIYADMNFAYPGWKLNMSEEAQNTTIDYVYSRQNKLEALTKTMELTPDLFWRVRFVNEKVIDISKFGDKKQYIFSKKPSGANNIRIVEDPTIEHDFENVINLVSVYSEKSDTGMSSMTLREVYNDPSLQIDGFPCVILRANVNNERNYKKYIEQFPKLAPNNELEYAIIDEESVALEGGTVIEGTKAFNDLAPFTPETDSDGKTKEVTDADRKKAAKTAYDASVRWLKLQRRSYKIQLVTEELPADLSVGDRVRFIYDNSVYILDSCSNYMKKILSYDDWFYITRIGYSIDGTSEVNEVTLEKFLRIDRETTKE